MGIDIVGCEGVGMGTEEMSLKGVVLCINCVGGRVGERWASPKAITLVVFLNRQNYFPSVPNLARNFSTHAIHSQSTSRGLQILSFCHHEIGIGGITDMQ